MKHDVPIDPRGWIAVRKSRNGRGLVALRPMRAGSRVLTIRGRVVSAATVWRYWQSSPRRGANCFRYDADRYLDPDGELGAYANHSCRPNTGIVKRGRWLTLRAIGDIPAGAEITHDYSTLLGADDVWTMRCNCGEPQCRGKVRNVAGLPAATLARYCRLGIVPKFIMGTATGHSPGVDD
jgi:SET domain-containing protein